MKKWFNENKVRLVISSIITLLPMLFGVVFWNKLPDMITTHWGADGIADGFNGKAFAVFVPTVIMFVLNIFCAFATAFDQNGRNQNKKAMGIIFWIIPIISLLVNGAMYNVAFTGKLALDWLFPALFGVLFVVMGNYMPKIKQNRTMGIKISWALNNEENWNKTHRLAGKLWVAGGLVLIATSFLPLKWAIAIMLSVFLVMMIVPVVYSYSIYRGHQKQGISYSYVPKSKAEKIAVKTSAIFVPLILIGVLILMFTGNIQYEFTEDSLKIDATYGKYSTIGYEFVDSVEFRDDFDFGIRNFGFGSPKLSLGNFRNEEFGSYTLYAYTKCNSAVVIKSGDQVLVITGEDNAQTEELYNSLKAKID